MGGGADTNKSMTNQNESETNGSMTNFERSAKDRQTKSQSHCTTKKAKGLPKSYLEFVNSDYNDQSILQKNSHPAKGVRSNGGTSGVNNRLVSTADIARMA